MLYVTWIASMDLQLLHSDEKSVLVVGAVWSELRWNDHVWISRKFCETLKMKSSSITKPPKNSIKKKRRKLLNYQKRQMHNCNFPFLLKKSQLSIFQFNINWLEKVWTTSCFNFTKNAKKKNYWTYNWCTRKNKMQLSKCSFISMFFAISNFSYWTNQYSLKHQFMICSISWIFRKSNKMNWWKIG